MKTYSIGRDLNCDIVINDATDVISRRHALLNIAPSGKMTIIDQSSNGTYVNGIRISQNVPVPVTRKDIVSLAHVAKLDWNQVPKSRKLRNCALIACGAVIVIGLIFGIRNINSDSGGNADISPDAAAQVDSLALSKKEAVRLDSIKNAERQDSIKKASGKTGKDSMKSTRRVAQPKAGEKNTGGAEKPKEEKSKETNSQAKKRAIG